jgi:hypothetical protein
MRRVTQRRGTTLATGGTTTVRDSRATGGTMTVTGGTTMAMGGTTTAAGSRVTGSTMLATGGPSTKEGQQGDRWHNDSDGRHDDGIREQG